MSEDILHIKSISQLHELGGLPKPKHPLITTLDVNLIKAKKEHLGLKINYALYSIGLKDKSCGSFYGRNTYDFNEGVLFFTAPNQVQTVGEAQIKDNINGWVILFHPDLIRNTPLGKSIDQYHFFSYDVNEALHLSEDEQESITECVNIIKKEISERIDNHSQIVISSTLELILNLSKRYYERQFNTRSATNSDIVSRFQSILKEYYDKGYFTEIGTPSLDFFSDKIHVSSNYLSDLLKKETGYTAKDHINNFIIDRAKTLLLNNNDSVSGIAYTLGFNYPHYFTRLFKSKTGMTPNEYRQID